MELLTWWEATRQTKLKNALQLNSLNTGDQPKKIKVVKVQF